MHPECLNDFNLQCIDYFPQYEPDQIMDCLNEIADTFGHEKHEKHNRRDRDENNLGEEEHEGKRKHHKGHHRGRDENGEERHHDRDGDERHHRDRDEEGRHHGDRDGEERHHGDKDGKNKHHGDRDDEHNRGGRHLEEIFDFKDSNVTNGFFYGLAKGLQSSSDPTY